MAQFPTADWAQVFMEKLNRDEQYAQIAHKWEGDILFVIQPEGGLNEPVRLYFDLWHGKCRDAFAPGDQEAPTPSFVLQAPYGNFKKILTGELHPMQALMTRKLSLQGNMATLMRNVPTVLDFVRCAREITDDFV